MHGLGFKADLRAAARINAAVCGRSKSTNLPQPEQIADRAVPFRDRTAGAQADLANQARRTSDNEAK
jgi:hypothetical protein